MKKAISSLLFLFLFSGFALAGPPLEMKRESDELVRKNPAKVQKMLGAASQFLDEYRKPENEKKRQIFFKEIDLLLKDNYRPEQIKKVEKLQKELGEFVMSYASSTHHCRDPLPKELFFYKRDVHLFYGDSMLVCKDLPPINKDQQFRRYCLTVEKVGDKYKCRFFNFSDHDIP